LFFLFAFGGALRGARSMSTNIAYGLLVMALSTGSLYGSYRAIFSTVLAGTSPKQLAAARAAERAARAAHPEQAQEDQAESSPTGAFHALSKQAAGTPSPDPEAVDGPQQEVGGFAERTAVGANEEDDLKATSEISNTHERSKGTFDKLQQMGPTIAQ
jgi:hypothetical protein